MADKKITELELATPDTTDVIPFVDISDTTMGLSGTTKKATKADLKGEKGDNATVDTGTTTTGNAGTNASVVNSGTTQNAVFDFTIPRGDKGETGDAGACVESVAFVGDDIVFTLDDASTVTLVGAKTSLKGDTGAQVESVAFVGDDMVFTLDDTSTATLVGAKTDLKGDTGEAGDDAYVYIAYASADDGTDFTTTFNPLLNYIAIKTTTTPIASPQASDFTGLWKNYKGEKGDTGDIGVDWQGAWSAGTYTITQAVSHNGSSWICTATSTTEEPSISATDWDLIAQKGTDGTGSGDISGSGVENEIAYFTAEKTIDNLPVATYPSLTELSYVKGVTSGIQTQLGNKEITANKVTSFQAIPDDSHYPSEKLTYDQLALKADLTTPTDSLYRQAIINGNFDVWQRGTSFTPVEGVNYFTADRYLNLDRAGSGGTLPTISRSRQSFTTGDLFSSFYFQRLTTDGAGTSLGTNALSQLLQKIENGTSKLCGASKTVTVSFYARSSITGKKIGIHLLQEYGTGGSPTASEIINGINWTLTSTWTKYTYTFTTNTLVGKTFGTNNDDTLQLFFQIMWADQYKGRIGASTAETYVGAGDIDIAQVQLNAGSVALPFQPKSFADELRDCQRYYEKSFNYVITPADASGYDGSFLGIAQTVTHYFPLGQVFYKVKKRTIVTPTLYNPIDSSLDKIRNLNANTNHPAAITSTSEDGFFVYIDNSVSVVGNGYAVQWASDAEL